MLKVDDVVVRYGAATALDGVSLTVEQGEMVAWSARTERASRRS